MFYSAGNFEGKILDVVFAESRFSPNDPDAFDVCIHVEGPQCDGKPQDDWWRGEISAKFGQGNFSNKTQCEITMDALRSIGFEGDDLTRVDQLKGKVIPYKVEARARKGKTYYDVKYIGGGSFAPKALAGKANFWFYEKSIRLMECIICMHMEQKSLFEKAKSNIDEADLAYWDPSDGAYSAFAYLRLVFQSATGLSCKGIYELIKDWYKDKDDYRFREIITLLLEEEEIREIEDRTKQLTYKQKLKHPKWQKRRLEKLTAANWSCEKCKDDNSPLHVHHIKYAESRNPWDVSDEDLIVLCESCHSKEHNL